MDKPGKVTWAPPEGALAADQEPPLHCRLHCQLPVFTPHNHRAPPALPASATSCPTPWQPCQARSSPSTLHRNDADNVTRTCSSVSVTEFCIATQTWGALWSRCRVGRTNRGKELSHFLENHFFRDRTKQFRSLSLNYSFHRNFIIIKRQLRRYWK